MERVLSGKPRRSGTPTVWTPADEAPWSRKRMAYQPPDDGRPMRSSVAYAELHAHSAYSFLDGASAPEELVEEAVRLGLRAIALTDHNGLYGAVRFAASVGQLAGNPFLTLVDGLEQLPQLGQLVLWKGAQDVCFEIP